MYYQCFPSRGKARKDTNKSLISNTFLVVGSCAEMPGQAGHDGEGDAVLQYFENFFKKVWKFNFLSYLCNPKSKRWW